MTLTGRMLCPPDPQSKEYEALDRDGKAKALIAATAEYEEAMRKAEAAAQVISMMMMVVMGIVLYLACSIHTLLFKHQLSL